MYFASLHYPAKKVNITTNKEACRISPYNGGSDHIFTIFVHGLEHITGLGLDLRFDRLVQIYSDLDIENTLGICTNHTPFGRRTFLDLKPSDSSVSCMFQ